MNINKKKYDASSIKVLDGIEAIRKHPGMYIGDTETSDGPIQLLFEVLDNSVDEHISGNCDFIKLEIFKDDSILVYDNGRGIPTGEIIRDGKITKSALEVIFTEIHSGGKFDNSSYEFSGGLHGVGLSAVNALSEYLESYSCADGNAKSIKFSYGKKISNLSESSIPNFSKGTIIKFKPDHTIFKNIALENKTIISKLRYISALHNKLKIHFINHKDNTDLKFAFSGGINEFLNAEINDIGLEKNLKKNIIISGRNNEVSFEICFNWVKNYDKENIKAFTNSIIQSEGGSHVNGLKSSITKVISKMIYKFHLLKKEENVDIIWNDIKKGFFCIINARVKSPKFASQTKDKLISLHVKTIIEEIILDRFTNIIENDAGIFKPILSEIAANTCIRNRDKNLKESSKNQSKLFSAMLFEGNLSECKEKDPEKCEMFIVEGESAGGSAKQGRNRLFQSILTLRGKILNIEKCSLNKSMSSKIIRSIIYSIGGEFGINEVSIKNIRYNKIIIMTDADVDGSHIRALLLALFYRFVPSIILNKHLYVAIPPLYGISYKKNFVYFNEEDKMYQFMLKEKIDTIINSFDFLKEEIKSCDIIQVLTKILKIKNLSDILVKSLIINYDIIDLIIAYKGINKELINYIKQNNNYIISNIDSEVIITCKKTLQKFKFNVDNLDKRLQFIINLANSNEINNIKNILKKNIDVGIYVFANMLYEKIGQSFFIQRYKGLGEMNPEQLWSTSMDPNNRTLKLVTLNDIESANYICEQLLGNDANLRKIFIEENAIHAEADF